MLDQYFHKNNVAFCPYILAWRPDEDTCMQIVEQYVAAWAKMLEMSIPFSDPSADGPLLTQINHEMVEKNMTIDKALPIIARIKERFPELWVVVMVYANLIYQYGIERFTTFLADHKIDSYLSPDLPVEEIAMIPDHGWVARTMIVSDNLDDVTIAQISEQTDGFLYVLSSIKTTWSDVDYKQWLQIFVERIRCVVWDEQKLVVWFGIKEKADVDFLRTLPVDGYIVWTEIVRQYNAWWVEWVSEFMQELQA